MCGMGVQVRNASGPLNLSGVLDEEEQPFQGLPDGKTLTYNARVRNDYLRLVCQTRKTFFAETSQSLHADMPVIPCKLVSLNLDS
jgi:hypothetical protein